MKKICSIVGVFLIALIWDIAFVSADTDLDYTKGRPMLENEVKYNKSLEPELSELFQFKDGKLPLQNTQGITSSRVKRQALPLKYDMREKPYAEYIKVKNQRSTGLCWAFAVSSVSEIAYLKQQGDSDKIFAYSEFSPAHFGYFLFNRINDPLGNTEKDKNVIKVSGEDYRNFGGNNYMSFQALANWEGFALESKAPFNNGLTNSYDATLAYDDVVHITNAEFLNNNEQIKQAILKNGAVAVEMYFDNKNLNYDTSAYYDANGTSGGNHAVAIVGWDDSYKKENFSGDYSGLHTPDNNGAWIVQNSYGPQWGDNGYFYISYEDKSLGNALTIDVQPAGTYDYNYQYDGNVLMQYGYVDVGEKMANIYKVKGSDTAQQLKAVGFTDWNGAVSTSYNVKIYTELKKKNDPTSGTESASFDVTTDHTGYHSFTVPEGSNIMLNPNSYYSIVLTMKSASKFGIESASNYYQDINFEAGQEKNQSFWYRKYSKTWTDLYDDSDKNNSCAARIKGYTGIISSQGPETNPAFGEGKWIRLSGKTRYETSIEISNALKKKLKVDRFNAVIVAYGNNFPDALTGSYLAGKKNAPILLVGTDVKTEKKVREYIQQNLNENGIVYILGGTGVVTKRFADSLGQYSVKRLEGSNRYETNEAILNEAGVSGRDILICSGQDFADSLSASATGKPIVLVGDQISGQQKKYLKSFNNTNLKKFYIIGGSGAVSDDIETDCSKIGDVKRVSGNNRFSTSRAVAEQFFKHQLDTVMIARAYDFPDGLSGGSLALSIEAPLLLVENDNYKDALQYIEKNKIQRGAILGGTGVISDKIAERLFFDKN